MNHATLVVISMYFICAARNVFLCKSLAVSFFCIDIAIQFCMWLWSSVDTVFHMHECQFGRPRWNGCGMGCIMRGWWGQGLQGPESPREVRFPYWLLFAARPLWEWWGDHMHVDLPHAMASLLFSFSLPSYLLGSRNCDRSPRHCASGDARQIASRLGTGRPSRAFMIIPSHLCLSPLPFCCNGNICSLAEKKRLPRLPDGLNWPGEFSASIRHITLSS